MSIMQTLRESKLFAGVGEEHLQALVPAFRRIDVEKESIVLKEGEPARYVYLVEEGRVILHVNLERPDGSSTGPTTFASITPGEAFGWSALVEPRLNTLSASAAERSSLIRVEEAALRGDVQLRSRDGIRRHVEYSRNINGKTHGRPGGPGLPP